MKTRYCRLVCEGGQNVYSSARADITHLSCDMTVCCLMSMTRLTLGLNIHNQSPPAFTNSGGTVEGSNTGGSSYDMRAIGMLRRGLLARRLR